MKVKADRNFWLEDKVRGTMVNKRAGDGFEMDENEESETIYTLLQGGKITVVDNRFIPQKGSYRVIYSFSYRNEAGFPRTATGGKEVTLPQAEASKLLTDGYIVPINSDAWTPKKLLQSNLRTTEPIKMFDETPPKSNWVTKGRQ